MFVFFMNKLNTKPLASHTSIIEKAANFITSPKAVSSLNNNKTDPFKFLPTPTSKSNFDF